MNDSEIIRISSALMQFGVACYALRLGKLFNTSRVGWLVFSTLSLLAVIYILAPTHLLSGFIPMGNKVDIVYGLVSIVLILGMVYLDFSSKNRRDSEKAAHESRAEWETQVEAKWDGLNKANEELRGNVSQLQADLTGQKQAREKAEKALEESNATVATARQTEEELRQSLAKLQTESIEQNANLKRTADQAEQSRISVLQAAQDELSNTQSQLTDLQKQQTALQEEQGALKQQLAASQEQLKASQEQFQEQLSASRRAEEELRGTIARLQSEIEGQKQTQQEVERTYQERLVAARQSGVTDATVNVLPHVDNLLQGLDAVSLSANDLAESSMGQVSRIGKLMREKTRKTVTRRRSPLDRQLRECLAHLAQRINDEKLQITRKIGLVKKTVGELKELAPTVPKAEAVSEMAAAEVEQVSIVAGETETETATMIAPVEEPVSAPIEEATPVIAVEPETVSSQAEEPVPAPVVEATPIQMDDPIQFDGGSMITLENYQDMPVGSVELGDHLISSVTHTGTESAETPAPAEVEPDQAGVRSNT